MTLTLILLGCGGRADGGMPSERTPGGQFTTGSPGTSDGTSDGATSSSDKFDVGQGDGTGPGDEPGECGPADAGPTNATLTGRVFAPNLELPISGALVYLTSDPVAPIPDGVYCSECVELPCDSHYVFTGSDGSFELPANAGTGQTLVVQKGDFLRTVVLDVLEGDNPVANDLSNLPGEWNPAAGMWIPRIAVYDTDPDKVFNVLAKFGLGDVDASGELVRGTERFTLIDDDSDQGAFMDDATRLMQYHIVFVPCAATNSWLGAPTVPATRIQNIQAYVESGGRWYATDHSNEYVKEPFPSYLDLHQPAMPDIQPAYNSLGTVRDSDMLSWLDALPAQLKDIGGGNPTLNTLPQVELRANYTGIEAVHSVMVQDDEGNDVDVGPYTWVEGPCSSCTDGSVVRPMAITGSYGCGRMMYSTFENSSEAHLGLNPQELILLYMILEIGVCHTTTPPPPPAG